MIEKKNLIILNTLFFIDFEALNGYVSTHISRGVIFYFRKNCRCKFMIIRDMKIPLILIGQVRSAAAAPQNSSLNTV